MLFSVLNINSGLALTHGNPRQAPFKNSQEQRFDLRVKPGEDGDNGVVILAVDTDSDDILTVSGCNEWLLETVESRRTNMPTPSSEHAMPSRRLSRS